MPCLRTWGRIVGIVVGVGIGVGSLAVDIGATAATPTRASPAPVRYTVRAGDSFYGVANRFGIRASALAAANHLTLSSVLLPGQVLVVPGVQLPANLPAHLPAPLLANPDRLLLFPHFEAAAKEAGVPADLLMATAYIESGWKQMAISATGAVGVGQLKPDTARWIAVVLMHKPGLDPADAGDNIRMSARFLRYLVDAHSGDLRRALAAYYQGPGSVARDGVSSVGLVYAGKILAVRSAFA
ncbi:MAG TPA: transglycosylase SLT domain-containing protein [Acidimicrobiales bacterium]